MRLAALASVPGSPNCPSGSPGARPLAEPFLNEAALRAAEGGTLFLDEIGDLPLETQPKLLRFLDSKEIHPLGGATPQRVAVRIVAATHADLERDRSSRTAT